MGSGSPHTRFLSLVAAAIAVVSIGVTAGCGGDDDGASEAGGDTSAQTAADQAPKTSEPAGGRDDERQASGPTLSGNRQEAEAGLETVDGVYDNLAGAVGAVTATKVLPREMLDKAADDENLAGVCDLMSEEAQRQTVVYAERSSGLAGIEWNCENAMGLLLRRSSDARGSKRPLIPKVVGVNAQGDHATASLRFGRRVTSVSLVKEDGEWKLAASPSGGGK